MISLADLKLALRIDGTAEDNYLTALEAAAVAAVERWTGRSFAESGARTEYLTGAGIDRLWLAETPAADPALTVTEAAYPGAETTAITAADADGYVIRERTLVRRGGIWHAGYEYAVTYTAGYAAGEEPADIRQAVMQLVGHWYENREPVVVGTVAAPIPLTVRDLLAPWRRYVA